jgi:hypothetical protein
MPLDFPSSPTDGQIYEDYYYDSTVGVWNSLGNSEIPNILSNGVFTASSGTTVPLTVNGASGQSANLQEWKSNAESTLASISANGGLSLNTPLSVQNGGTGASSLTLNGYLKGTGTSAITSQSGIPATDLTGTIDSGRLPTIPVSVGGTGSATGSGLVPIIPTSVNISGGSASTNANGEVSFSSTNFVRLNGVFSSTYTNYRIVYRGIATSNVGIAFRFSTNGSDATDNNYAYNVAYWGSRGSGTGSSASLSFIGYIFGHNRHSWSGDIFSPNLASNRTHLIGHGAGSADSDGAGEIHFDGGTYKADNVFDGINLFTNGTFQSGTVQVLGYRD